MISIYSSFAVDGPWITRTWWVGLRSSKTLVAKNFGIPRKVSYFPNFGSLIPNPTIIFDLRPSFCSVASLAFFFGQKLHFREYFEILKFLKTFLF